MGRACGSALAFPGHRVCACWGLTPCRRIHRSRHLVSRPFFSVPSVRCVRLCLFFVLYHIGSLFTNFDHTQYFNGGAIIAGELIPNTELTQKFPNTLASDWDIIKQAVQRSPFYNTIRQGKKPFENGEFVATITMYRNTIKIHDIYRIKKQIGHEIYLEFWERVENNDWVIEQTNQVGKPNQRTPDGNYPLLKDLFRIHLSPIKNSNTFRVYALQYKKVTKNNTLQWINEGSFGVLQEQYNSEYKGNNFRDISKNYRKQSYEDSDYFHNIKQANPHMNWHKRFQAITHAYIETKMKNTIWRLITGKLYLGDIAQKYLISRKKPQAALKYEHCPYCSNTFTKSTIQHQLWESYSVRVTLRDSL